jgi:hypothetical protein
MSKLNFKLAIAKSSERKVTRNTKMGKTGGIKFRCWFLVAITLFSTSRD